MLRDHDTPHLVRSSVDLGDRGRRADRPHYVPRHSSPWISLGKTKISPRFKVHRYNNGDGEFRHSPLRYRGRNRTQFAFIVALVFPSTASSASTTTAFSEISTARAMSNNGGPRGVGRRNRTSKPAVVNGIGAPSAACQP